VLVLLATVHLVGCGFSFRNPSEALRAGQVAGTVLSDVAGGGTPVARGNVAVSLKGAAFDLATRPNGRFVVLDLPVGQHRLLFREGATWALERDVTIGWGSDGQPEGVELGNVVMHYSAAVAGSISLPPGNAITGGVAVDETSGLTAPLLVTAPTLADPAPPVTFRFPVLALGTHLIKLQATDGGGGTWVGGQVVVNLTAAEQGTTVTLANVAARAASATGRLRFRVQAIGLLLPPGALTVNLLPDPGLNPITPASDGSVDVTVPEGLYAIQLVVPATATPLARLATGAGTVARAAAPVPTVAPPAVYAVVLEGRVAEAGSVYVASDATLVVARTSCRDSADCGGSACAAGVCPGRSPGPPPVAAATTFCTPCRFDPNAPTQASCAAGPGVVGSCACPAARVLAKTCLVVAAQVPPEPSYCAPGPSCFSCTPDGTATVSNPPATGVCP
jgi:hypothetical protein